MEDWRIELLVVVEVIEHRKRSGDLVGFEIKITGYLD
jgi:hypothetical protein